MEDLIKALQIFLKYGNSRNPAWCIAGEFNIDINPEIVSDEDKQALSTFGFFVSDDRFVSFRFGAC